MSTILRGCSIVVFACFLLCIATLARADERKALDFDDTVDKFTERVAWVRSEMEGEGQFSGLNPSQKRLANLTLDKMADLMRKYGSVTAMPELDKIRLYNAQEKVNAILTADDADRFECEKASLTGSQIKTAQCRNLSDSEMRRRREKQFLRERNASLGCKNLHCTTGQNGLQ